MTAPRVLHVFKVFRPRFSGEAVFLERLAPVFAQLRPDVLHEVLVTATAPDGKAPPPPGLAAVHYLSARDEPASQARLAAWLARRAGRYRVVHHHTHADRTFLGSLCLKLRGARVLLSATLDDSAPGLLRTYRPLLRPVVRLLLRLHDRFIAISPRLQAENLTLMHAEKTALVPIGIPLPPAASYDRSAARRELDLPEDAAVLVCVGGVCRRKEQHFLVERMPAVLQARPDALLLLVGPVLEPDYGAEIARLAARLGLAHRVRFTGHATQPDRFYRAADLFVFASRTEGFGTVVIEAMAHGLPVIARKLAGVNDDFVASGVTGELFEDAEGFDTAAASLLTDPERARRMGAEAQAQVRRRVDIQDVAARYLDLYGYPAEARP